MNLALRSTRTAIGIVLVTLALSALFLARGVCACLDTELGEPPLNTGSAAVPKTSFKAQRALIDSVLKDPMSAWRSIRIMRPSGDGREPGVKLYGIRKASMFGALGLQNGDAVHAINGLPIATREQALKAYAQLRSATKLAVLIERRGQPLTLEYVIE